MYVLLSCCKSFENFFTTSPEKITLIVCCAVVGIALIVAVTLLLYWTHGERHLRNKAKREYNRLLENYIEKKTASQTLDANDPNIRALYDLVAFLSKDNKA